MIVKKAGCILLDIKNKNVGLIYRKKQDDYSFPKGHLEEGEALEECAVRETEEETGRKCHLLPSKKLPIVEYTNVRDGDVEVQFFLASDEGKSFQVFDEELVHELVWTFFENVENKLTYDDSKKLWNETKDIIIEIFEK